MPRRSLPTEYLPVKVKDRPPLPALKSSMPPVIFPFPSAVKLPTVAGDFRVSIGLWRTVAFILGVIALGIAGAWRARVIQWLAATGLGRVSLKARVQRA